MGVSFYDDISPKEKVLFEHYDFLEVAQHCMVPDALKVVGVKVFIKEEPFDAWDRAVQRAIRHLQNGKYRGNQEWEDLITVE